MWAPRTMVSGAALRKKEVVCEAVVDSTTIVVNTRPAQRRGCSQDPLRVLPQVRLSAMTQSQV